MIEVEYLSFSYDKSAVLEGMNLSIHDHEFIGIFGPNGGGKTTFLKLLMGFIHPQKGKVRHPYKKIGYVPQAATFDRQFPITLEEAVLQGCLQTGLKWGFFTKGARQKTRECLAKVGLQGFEKKPLGALSGGQIQRAFVARALVSDPDFL